MYADWNNELIKDCNKYQGGGKVNVYLLRQTYQQHSTAKAVAGIFQDEDTSVGCQHEE